MSDTEKTLLIVQDTFDLTRALGRAFQRVLIDREQRTPADQFLAALSFMMAGVFEHQSQDPSVLIRYVQEAIDPGVRTPLGWRAHFINELVALCPREGRVQFFATLGAGACRALAYTDKPTIYRVGRDAGP